MKAKIQITVNMEEIPDEVRNRIEKVFYKAENSTADIKQIMGDISENNMLTGLEKIDKVRKELSFIDSVLDDAYNILVGYTKYKSKQYEELIPPENTNEVEHKNE